jgi:hypothetical protein
MECGARRKVFARLLRNDSLGGGFVHVCFETVRVGTSSHYFAPFSHCFTPSSHRFRTISALFRTISTLFRTISTLFSTFLTD